MKTIKFIVILISTCFIISCSKENSEVTTPIPAFVNGLNFEKIKDIPDNLFETQLTGLVANSGNNSLYLSCRDFLSSPSKELTYKLDLNNLNLTSEYLAISDFATKRDYIFNNKLYVFGGKMLNKYALDLSVEESNIYYSDISNPYFLVFSRFGFAAQNENAYIIGGFLGGSTEDPNYDKKIWKYNLIDNTLNFVANMPTSRSCASAEIVNNKIYSFFGIKNQLINNPAEELLDNVQIYDITTNSFQNITIPNAVKLTYTAKYNNYIFVAGNKQNNPFSEDSILGSYFGYFDTTTNTMTEIPITVSNNSYSFPYICEIEIMNNKIYALVKNTTNTFSIQVANLQ